MVGGAACQSFQDWLLTCFHNIMRVKVFPINPAPPGLKKIKKSFHTFPFPRATISKNVVFAQVLVTDNVN